MKTIVERLEESEEKLDNFTGHLHLIGAINDAEAADLDEVRRTIEEAVKLLKNGA